MAPTMKASPTVGFRQQLESLYSISIEISRLHEMPPVLNRALGFGTMSDATPEVLDQYREAQPLTLGQP